MTHVVRSLHGRNRPRSGSVSFVTLLTFSCLLLLTLLLMGGCSEPDRSVLKFGLSSNPITLDPRFATDAASSRVNRLIYARLTDFDQGFKPVPALASWVQLSDTHYRFTLGEQGREFHDGSRLTTSDVEATYASILDADSSSAHRGSLKHIERIEIVDENVIDFRLSRPDPLFPGFLGLGIVPARLIGTEHPINRQPVGSGALKFVDWPQDGKLTLERVADRQRIEFLKVPKPTVRVLKLLRGEIDLMQNDLLPELVSWLEARDDINVTKARGTNFAYLGFNMEDPVVGDPRVRRAIAHAVDREAIVRYVMGGGARLANAILPPEHWAGAPELVLIEHDPERARQILAELGYDRSNPLRVVYKTSTNPVRVRIATIIQDQLAQAGIEVELSTYDWGTFYGDIKAGRFQMYSLAWVGIKLPDIFRYTMHSESLPDAGANRGRFISDTADRLIEQAESNTDLERQAALYRELQAHLLDELPYVPLWYEDHYLVARSGVSGYDVAADGNYDGLKQVVSE